MQAQQQQQLQQNPTQDQILDGPLPYIPLFEFERHDRRWLNQIKNLETNDIVSTDSPLISEQIIKWVKKLDQIILTSVLSGGSFDEDDRLTIMHRDQEYMNWKFDKYFKYIADGPVEETIVEKQVKFGAYIDRPYARFEPYKEVTMYQIRTVALDSTYKELSDIERSWLPYEPEALAVWIGDSGYNYGGGLRLVMKELDEADMQTMRKWFTKIWKLQGRIIDGTNESLYFPRSEFPKIINLVENYLYPKMLKKLQKL